ncbi:hemophore [Mycobacterium sp.]|uniref:hemophore n=1 Tax=Mycobacterium sp. TaxID=1785 RepID=UPI003D6AE04A
MAGSPATLRHRLIGVLSATALGGAITVATIVPSATAASDPCSASEMARTVGSVAKSAGDYLDGHPETNQAMTTILRQPAGPQSVTSLKSYFEAHPKVASDLQTISQPLTGLSTECKLPVSIPQMLGLMQGAQGGTVPAPTGPLPGPAAGVPPTVIR